ncbi:2-oxoglutarate dehydrogenase E1 component [Neobacillus terrae]|uniref:2-oxoglutarate dehydrogenase E1 component n=1 Tax=Neobacillus terrae TaxID=3034837 RepID=UPI001FB100DF|nr:2-oxoglutarate dehydrogenase E1 component [Neobacillus terrae]
MKRPGEESKKFLESFYGPNLGYVMGIYEQYLENPESVDPEMRMIFDQLPIETVKAEEVPLREANYQADNISFEKIVAAARLAENIRSYGHLEAKIYPLGNERPKQENLTLEHYGLSEEDLKIMPPSIFLKDQNLSFSNALEAYKHLKQVYTKSIAFEFHHVHSADEKKWLQQKAESGNLFRGLSKDKQLRLLKRLTEVEDFEKFLHRTFAGQKRFSIEGLDVMVPMLDEMIYEAVREGAETVNIGMAHRGRLNVLAHVLNKPYEKIFSEFQHAPNKDLVPSEGSSGINYGWTGDVKYHLGLNRQIKEENLATAKVTLANNPSHLEFVGAVVEGFTRAAQEDRTVSGEPRGDFKSSLALLIHGDAAFPGEGIVAETLNLSRLNGYRTGGTIHIISNNTIGFTTESSDSRSTLYASDLAKGFEIPIIHVNADDPEACIAASILAVEYRIAFQKDFLIDLVGYRRYGHNEMDEPMTTSPLMYTKIHEHLTIKELYAKTLIEKGGISESDFKNLQNEVESRLKAAYEKVPPKDDHQVSVPVPPETVEHGLPKVDTSVPAEKLNSINEHLLHWPNEFSVFPKLEKILKRRSETFKEKSLAEWGLAESFAFASILADGTPIRLTGQDSERGTFAQRNLVLHDHNTGKRFSALQQYPEAKASFALFNSPLTETAVLGFEYGYNVFAPETLVIWEAQYGDFANVAQVIFDQFIAAGRAKWGQKSGLVMLLPHSYEGQGPEHSSGRLERYLQLAAENNWTVANLTSAAQYFHILRRQAAILKQEEVRPLIIMTPKSLLRNPMVMSTAKELSEGKFSTVIEEPGLGTNFQNVERVILCSGKIAIDLSERVKEAGQTDWLHILRVEQIYPFPLEKVREALKRYPNLKEIYWVQEEPKNMGAWNFVEPRIQETAPNGIKVEYVGRRRRSSPAGGDPTVHKLEQNLILQKSLTRSEQGGESNGRN